MPQNAHGAQTHGALSQPQPQPQSPTVPVAAPAAPPADSGAPPKRLGPCPKPTQKLKQLAAHAFKLAEQSQATEPHRAIAEAIRLRLDQLFKSGCGVGLDSKQLTSQVALLSDSEDIRAYLALTISAGHLLLSYYAGDTSGLALYAWRGGRIVTRINVSHDGPKMEQRLLLLVAKVFQPPGAPEPLLAISNTHPWLASCWRSLRFRVLEPSGDPVAPRVLLDRQASGRWCEDHDITAKDSRVTFSYPDWHSLFRLGMTRNYNLSYEYGDGSLAQRFGFSGGFNELVEDWLAADWSLASEASVLAHHATLQPEHAQLHAAAKRALARTGKAEVTFSTELFPGGSAVSRRLRVYCALSQAETKPCADWPRPVDFALERQGEHWLVAGVVRL